MLKEQRLSFVIPANIRVYVGKKTNILLFYGVKARWGINMPNSFRVEKVKDFLWFFFSAQNSSFFHTFFTLCKNLARGVSKNYSLFLILKGLGYRVQEKSLDNLILKLGFSHIVTFPIFKNNVFMAMSKPTVLSLSSVSKQSLGNVAYDIRRMRKPNVYKGKGVLFRGEKIHLKVGKKS